MAWNDPLARPLDLDDGATPQTLKDAATLFAERFDGVTHAPPLEHAIELLMRAAGSGQRADVEAATEQVARVLQLWHLMTSP
jgi:hypothetical protein